MAQENYLEIGQIVTTHGVRGEVRVKPWCDSSDVLLDFTTLYFDKGQKPIDILEARVHKNVVILKIDGVDTMEEAQKLRNKILYAARDDFELPEGTYFIADLLGSEIVDNKTGEIYGKLTDVLQYGASDVYEITNENKKVILIPAIPDVVEKTDLENNRIYINMMEGLIDNED